MQVSVLLFARARELAGSSVAQLSVEDPAQIGDVRDALVARFPALEHLAPSLLWAVHHQYVTIDHQISAADEIACFPPVSGG